MLGDIIFGTLGFADDMTNGLLSGTAAVGCAVVAEMIPDTPAAVNALAPAPNFVLPSSLTARGAMIARLIDKTVKFESLYPYRSKEDRHSSPNHTGFLVDFEGIGRIVNVKYDRAKDDSNAKILEFVIIEMPEEEEDYYPEIEKGLTHKKFLVDRTQIISIVNLLDKGK